jgi:hypothetical protein
MSRFFVSPHPTFGSYSNPLPWRAQASPYFWWWRALVWAQQQETLSESSLVGEQRDRWQQVLRDFGQLQATDDIYTSFCDWWREKMPNGEQRGVYLFAEPVMESKTQEVVAPQEANRLIADDRYIVIAVPKDVQLGYARESVDRILKRHNVRKEGRQVRDPKRSLARYQLTKSVQVDTMKKAFGLYEERMKADLIGDTVKNVELAKRVNLKHDQKVKDQVIDKAARNRIVSVIVSRYLKFARDAIGRVQLGSFP